MTPEVIARVDAWLKAQPYAWLTPERAELVGMWLWLTVTCELRGLGEYPKGRKAALTGILLALVREARGDPWLYCRYTSQGWCVVDITGFLVVSGNYHETEADALVACLEAAPAKEAA